MTQKEPEKTLARVLVVEDDATIADMLGKILREEGYNVLCCDDGQDAFQKLSDFNPDLALLDLHVPHQSGFDILREIRKRDQDLGTYIPAIVLTGVYTSRNDKVTSLDAGADDFLHKPFDLVELLARVRSLLRVHELYKRSQFLASHDPLTKCYNRRYLMDFLSRSFERYKRYHEPFAYVLLDLDKFKEVNDTLGHDAGDQVLVSVGFALQDFFRAVDCVARVGGDEFAAVLPGCRPAESEAVAERLIQLMSRPGILKGLPPGWDKRISYSIGVACLPDHAQDVDKLVQLADQAMYAAKKAGRNQFKISKI